MNPFLVTIKAKATRKSQRMGAELRAVSSSGSTAFSTQRQQNLGTAPLPKEWSISSRRSGCFSAVTSVTSQALPLLGCPSSQAISECSTHSTDQNQLPSHSHHTWQVDLFHCYCCCFHFYHSYYRYLISEVSFTHVRKWKKSPNYLLFPSVMEQG